MTNVFSVIKHFQENPYAPSIYELETKRAKSNNLISCNFRIKGLGNKKMRKNETPFDYQCVACGFKSAILNCVKLVDSIITRQVYNLFQDLWNRFPYLGGWGKCQG